jgi:CubicO group peptidase (beta-lactamase class C family)
MDPGYKRVTLEQIMLHRGGIPQDLGLPTQEVQRIAGKAKIPFEIRARYTRDILGRKPAAQPGAQFLYSNGGYALLSHVAEAVAGKPYEQLVRDLVFKPLNLERSYTGIDKVPSGRVQGHATGPNGVSVMELNGPLEVMFAGSGGGILMSVGDLAKFGEAHLKGLKGSDGFLKAATVARLHKGVPEGPSGTRQYACGWGIESLPGIEAFQGHNGSDGTTRTELAIFPNSNLVVAAATNLGGEDEPSPPMQAVQAIADKWGRR